MIFILSEFVQLIYSFFSKKSRFLGLWGILFLGYLAGAANPNTTTDYSTYESHYYDVSLASGYFEKGYTQLGQFMYRHGLSYADFRLIISIVCAVILYMGVRRFTKNIALFSALYGITVFFNDATQSRNFIMISLVVLGASFLIDITKKNIIIAAILILISAQFQSLGYIFLLLIPLIFISKKNISLVTVYVIGTSFLVTLFFKAIGMNRVVGLLSRVAGLIGNRENLVQKISMQYLNGTSNGKLVLLTSSTLFGLYVIYRCIRLSENNPNMVNKLHVIYVANVISMVTLPLLLLAVDYSRIQRNIFLFTLIGIALFFENSYLIEKRKVYPIIAFTILLCMLVAFTHYYIWGILYQNSVPYLAHIKN